MKKSYQALFYFVNIKLQKALSIRIFVSFALFVYLYYKMRFIKNLFSLIIFIALLELIVFFQSSVFLILLFTALAVIFCIILTLKKRIFKRHGFLTQLNYTLLLVICTLSTISFLIFVPDVYYLQHIYIALSSFLFIITIIYLNKKFSQLDQEISISQQTLSDFIIVISAFLLYSSLFGLYLYLAWPIWLIMILLIVVTFILTYEFFFYNKLLSRHVLYALILTLIISELGWAVSLWPTGFISRSIVIFAIFYAFTGLSKHNFKHTLTNKVIRNYVILSIIIIIFVLITSKWTF